MGITNSHIIDFIDNFTEFPDYDGTVNSSHIEHIFGGGYCYYFAEMLRLAFGGGTVCWVQDRSHIVWLDGTDLETDTAYDINGVYKDYTRLWPVSYLGDMIDDFKGSDPDPYIIIDPDFRNWCDFSIDMPVITAISIIWSIMPISTIEKYYVRNLDMVESVYVYWSENKTKFKEYSNDFKDIKNAIEHQKISLHKGIDSVAAIVSTERKINRIIKDKNKYIATKKINSDDNR